jgi:hypothetical protein
MCPKIRGVQQECGLISYLFNIIMNAILEYIDVDRASCPGRMKYPRAITG